MNRPICVLAVIYILVIIGLHCLGVVFLDYDKVYSSVYKNEKYVGIILDIKEEKDYKTVYIIELQDSHELLDKKRFLINIKNNKNGNNSKNTLEYGDKIEFNGEYIKADGKRNYKGYDYSLYLKTQKLYGSFDISSYKIISKNNGSIIKKEILEFKKYVKEVLRKYLETNEAELCIGLTIGDRSGISKELEDDFKNSNLTHMLAVSGSHFTYIILAVGYFNNLLKRKRLGQILIIIIIIIFMELTGNTASVVRSGIMAIIMILSSIFYRKSDIWTSMALAIIFQLINNPYIIFDVGLQLSYGGVIGIVLFNEDIDNSLKKIFRVKNNNKEIKILNKDKVIRYIISAISVTISANLTIIPIMIANFNTMSFSFILSNLLAGPILGVVVIFAFILIFISLILKNVLIPFFILLNLFVKVLIQIAHICSNLPFSKIYLPTPNVFFIICFYIILGMKKYVHNKSIYVYKNIYIRKYASLLLVLIILLNFTFPVLSASKNNLEINFIDVGQGDSTLIRVNYKNILIDGGGSNYADDFDIGEMTLLPYLLDRGIMSLDYILVSHFDSDHCQGLMYVIENLKVKNVIISLLGQDSMELDEFLNVVKRKKINIICVKKGDIISLGDAKIEILYPDLEVINENIKNNNAIVCKFTWNDFSILFTGDIEKIAEEKILTLYKSNLDKIKSTVLKVAHHGSKSSSTKEFLLAVNPKIALIGVGKNNNFGHPNDGVIQRLSDINCKIYRTDKDGEIIIKNNGKKTKITKTIKNRI